MTSEYNKLYSAGDRLIIELKSKDIFNGLYTDGGKDRIVLSEVVQHNNNNKLSGFYEFYRNEIQAIHRLKAPPTKEKRPENDPPKTDCKVIKVSEDDYFRLKDMSQNFIYLENADKRYFDAVKVLSDSETIGVMCLGMDQHRRSSITLLALCTWKQVYIFDLSNVQERELYLELKDIFESECICKVIHKSAGLVDVLYRAYKVYVQNTFDTQIVDLVLQKRETGTSPAFERNISECLVHYLNLPSALLDRAMNVTTKQWQERPLSNQTKLYASQLVTYLILLKDHFQKLLLNDVYNTIAKVQDYVYDMDDFDFLNYNVKKNVPNDIQCMIKNLNDLSIGDKAKGISNSK